MWGREVLPRTRTHSWVRGRGCNGWPSTWTTTKLSASERMPMRNWPCRALCALSSATVPAESATVLARPLFGSLYRPHRRFAVREGTGQWWPQGLADLGLPSGQAGYCFRRPTIIVRGGLGF